MECLGAAGEAAEAAEAAAARASLLGRAATNAAAEVGQNEDSAQWRSQRKHFFVLSNAGGTLYLLPSCTSSCWLHWHHSRELAK